MKSRYPDLTVDLSFAPVHHARSARFTPAQIERFNHEGFIAGVRLLDTPRLAALETFLDREEPRLTAETDGFECFHHREPVLYDLVTDSGLVGYLTDLLGPDVVCHVTQYVHKPPGDPRRVRPHQDASYNPMDARSVVVWLAVTDATVDNGCLWFNPGSHRGGQLEFDDLPGGPDTYGGLETRDADALAPAVPVELPAGHAVFFSDLLVHRSGPNRTPDRPRKAFTATFAPTRVTPHHGKGRWSVLCAGEDWVGNWHPHHPRPDP